MIWSDGRRRNTSRAVVFCTNCRRYEMANAAQMTQCCEAAGHRQTHVSAYYQVGVDKDAQVTHGGHRSDGRRTYCQCSGWKSVAIFNQWLKLQMLQNFLNKWVRKNLLIARCVMVVNHSESDVWGHSSEVAGECWDRQLFSDRELTLGPTLRAMAFACKKWWWVLADYGKLKNTWRIVCG